MGAVLFPVISLLCGVGILLLGTGLFFTVLGLRAGAAGFPVPVIGLIMSAYFAGFIAGTFLCPGIIKRVGHIRAFAAMASVASVTAIIHALVVDPWVWGMLRAVTGVCLVGLYMVAESWLNVLAPNRQRGRILAAYMAVTLVAMGLGQFLILAGDVTSFVPFALVSILLSLALVPVALTPVEQPKALEAPKVSLRHLYAISPLGVYGALASGLLNSAFYGMGAVFAQRIGLSEAATAAFMSATIIGGAALQWPIGHFSDRHDRRVVLAVVCLLGAALAMTAFLAASRFPAALIVIGFAYGGLVFTVYGLAIAHVNDYLKPAQVLEATSGLLLVHGIGASIGPAAAGALMDALGPGSLLVYFTLVLLLLGALGPYGARIRPAPAEHREFVAVVSSSQAALEMDPRGEAEH